MNKLFWETALATALFAASIQPGVAQAPPPVILTIDVQNRVRYFQDTSDVSKFATSPAMTPSTASNNFIQTVSIGDIVAVNGQPAKGTMTTLTRTITLRPAPNAGEAMADTTRSDLADYAFEILDMDGRPIGTIVGFGPGGGSAPPGAPLFVTQGNNAIIGGTGAFLGARGYLGQAVNADTVTIRSASITEDPANRRRFPGGRNFFVLQVIPMVRPEIIVSASGPAVAHSIDFSLVTASKPAAAGEVLSAFVTGLGPTRPGVDPGKPFPASPLAVVNSPVNVTVNGTPAEVLAAVGFPGAIDGYQVNFRVPADTAKGAATVQVTAAWIAGPLVNIPIQ
jgi:hypothetical protein